MADTPLVLLSGGLDSTYLVSKLLQDGPVDVLYVNGGQARAKIERELKARDKLIELMNRIYPYKIQGQYEVLEPTYLHDGKNKKWIQPNAWMQGAYRVLVPDRHNSVKVAYVKDDGASFGYHLPVMERQWEAMLQLGYQGGHVPLEFPILHLSKLEILEQIDKRLIEHIWVCENPIPSGSCGKCPPCSLSNSVLRDYKLKHGETVFTTALKTIRNFEAEKKDRTKTHLSPYRVYESNFYDYPAGDYTASDSYLIG